MSDPAPPPLTVAVLAGGLSSEHEVSLSSGTSIREGLLAGGHRVLMVEIGRDGTWRRDGEPLRLEPAGGLLGADVVFPALHGPFGEDGVVQGLLESLNVPYVGSGVAASAVCMDKVLFKELMAARGVPQVAYAGIREENFRRSRAELLLRLAELGLPVFVKPAHLGSSLGIVRVTAAGELPEALDAAFAHDPLVIVEAMATGLEVECGVLANLVAPDGYVPPLASLPGEISFPGEWYDFKAKYTPGGMELRIPAGISAGAAERVRVLAVQAFEHAGCDGLARVDFFVEGEHVLVNELNTMPGFTPTSVYAKLLDATGVPYPALVDRLCRLGIERHTRHRAHTH